MGNGCTSGHSVCGIPRLSIRSIAATCTFMLTAIIMATLRYKFDFLYGEFDISASSDSYEFVMFIIYLLFVALAFIYFILS